nr:hypothetical protein BaRGS_029132 [Batillaria attramentaria]
MPGVITPTTVPQEKSQQLSFHQAGGWWPQFQSHALFAFHAKTTQAEGYFKLDFKNQKQPKEEGRDRWTSDSFAALKSGGGDKPTETC